MPDKKEPERCFSVHPLEELEMMQVDFWLHIMSDHARFILGGLPCNAPELRSEAQHFIQAYDKLQKRCKKMSGASFRTFVAEVCEVTTAFYHFKTHLLQLVITCRLEGNHIFASLLSHVRREAGYFLRLLAKCRENDTICPIDAVMQELTFWVEIMQEHVGGDLKMIDPVEEKIAAMFKEWLEIYRALMTQGQGLKDFLQEFMAVPDLMRFIDDVHHDTVELCEFQGVVNNLAEQCRLLNIMPHHFVGHQNQETQHFISLLRLLRETAAAQQEPCVCKNSAWEPEEHEESPCSSDSSDDIPMPCFKEKEKYAAHCSGLKYAGEMPTPCDVERPVPADAEPPVEKEPPAPPVPKKAADPMPEVMKLPVEVSPSSDMSEEETEAEEWQPGKHKWVGHWPRTLGKVQEVQEKGKPRRR